MAEHAAVETSLTFEYLPAVTIASMHPSTGPNVGGQLVTVYGTNFSPISSSSLSFGNAASSGVRVLSSTAIICMTPANDAGTVAVSMMDLEVDAGAYAKYEYDYGSGLKLYRTLPSTGSTSGGLKIQLMGKMLTLLDFA